MPVTIPSTSFTPFAHQRTISDDSLASTTSSTSSSPADAASASESGSSSCLFSPPSRDKVGIERAVSLQPRRRGSTTVGVRRRVASADSSPVTGGSYSSLPQSPAVSYLASLADKTAVRHDYGVYEAGDEIGPFLLVRPIATGTFSYVFEARPITGPTDARVALKIVKKDPMDPSAINETLHETHIWSRLDHPNIIKMLDVLDTDDAVFVVSELASGGSLLDYIKEHGKLDQAEARNIFIQVASALSYLHDVADVIHRDIKLENIVRFSDGTVKLVDFGLSIDLSTPPSPTSPSSNSTIQCSLPYCPPELLRNPPASPSPAQDAWALGCVLYAMLTGALPFTDDYAPRLQSAILNGRWDRGRLERCGVGEAAR
ncbi:Serine/threonine-protein kinase par-1, partial [Borealophlyctis nickersoniae]